LQLAVCHVCVATGCVSCLCCNWLCVMSLLQMAVLCLFATDRLNKTTFTITKPVGMLFRIT